MRKIQLSCLLLLMLFGSAIAGNAAVIYTIKHKQGRDQRGGYDFQYPLLTSQFTNTVIRNKVNGMIKEMLQDQSCEADPAMQQRMHSDSNIQVVLANQHIFSFIVNYDRDCGGPYPDSGAVFYVFDLSTGKQFDIKQQVKNFQKFKYQLVKKFLSKAPQVVSQGCDAAMSATSLSERDLKYLLKKDQLIVSQDYPHVMRACEFKIHLTCRQLAPYYKPHSLLAQLCGY